MNARTDAGSQLGRSSDAALQPRTSSAVAYERAEPNAWRAPLSWCLCPRCKSDAVRRSHRRGFDWLMSAIGFRPARCFTCAKRFYFRHSPVKG